MLFAVTLLLAAGLSQQSPTPPVNAETLRQAGQAVIDAGYRSDVPALERAITTLRPLINQPALAARAAYFSGFGHWQLALIVGSTDTSARLSYLDAAIDDLQTAMSLEPDNAETLLLLGHCFGMMRSADPAGAFVVQLQASALRAAAARMAPSNPRVVLIDAMGLYYRPPQAGGDRVRALERWHDALRLFETATANDVGWGHPEAYLWLSAVYSSNGDVAGAKAALEKALAIRPDFVAARTALAALPKQGAEAVRRVRLDRPVAKDPHRGFPLP